MSLNEVNLIGRVGANPEIHTFNNGDKVANFSLATSDHWTDDKGNKQESTEWHKIVLRGKSATIAESYLTKGMQVYIKGALRTRKYADPKTQQDKYITEIVSFNFLMLGRKNDSNEPQSMPADENHEPANETSQPKPQNTYSDQRPVDSEIPFD